MNLHIKNRTVVFFSWLLALCFLTGCGTNTKTDTPVTDLPEVPESFTLTETTVTVPGLTKEYTLLYLSDTHMIKLDGSETEQITENALPRAELFKDSEGIPSYERFPEWVQYANDYGVDMFLLGGDIVDFPSDANMTFLKESLQKLEMPYVYTLGNHDWTYPWDYMTPEGRAAYRPLFADLTNENPAASYTEYEEFVILSVDNSSNQLDPEALPVTEEALALGKPVIVLAHVPFSTDSLLEKASAMWNSPVSIGMPDKGGLFPDANTLAFQEKILAEDSPVVCVLSGHVHFYEKSMLNDSILQVVGGAGYSGQGVLLHIKG